MRAAGPATTPDVRNHDAAPRRSDLLDAAAGVIGQPPGAGRRRRKARGIFRSPGARMPSGAQPPGGCWQDVIVAWAQVTGPGRRAASRGDAAQHPGRSAGTRRTGRECSMYDAIQAETISLAGAGGDQIEAYLACPLGPGPFGSVVVIHHMPGYDEQTKEITRTFAAHGYNAVCPNLYSREAPGASPDDAAATARAAGGVPDV